MIKVVDFDENAIQHDWQAYQRIWEVEKEEELKKFVTAIETFRSWEDIQEVISSRTVTER